MAHTLGKGNDPECIVPILGDLACAVQDRSVSWVNGYVESSTSMLKLFVSHLEENAFPFPSNEELKRLYDTAQPASFGRGQEAVVDSSYRSGRTLTTDNFAINIRPDAALLQQIKAIMLDTGCKSLDEVDRHYVRAELYHVNLYGPGDFFKEHKDTPQTGIGHFGSLVFCLPTHFEGGAFVIRDTQQQEVRFDWGKTFAEIAPVESTSCVSSAAAPVKATVPYLAFASDLDHWVEPVISGYRVTLTFHLFRDALGMVEMMQSSLPRLLPSNSNNISCEMDAVRALKESRELRGKRVVFPLVHAYSSRTNDDLVLKGGDAALFQLLASFGVQPKVMFYYNYNKKDHYDDFDGCNEEEEEEEEEDDENEGDPRTGVSAATALASRWKGETCYLTDSVNYIRKYPYYAGEGDCPMNTLAEPITVLWARKLDRKSLLSVSAAYGNEPSVDKYYGNACIVTSW